MVTEVLIGVGSAPVVIREPVPMSGFAARTERSVGTAEPPPAASAVCFGEEVLVFLDAVGVDATLADGVREAAALEARVSVLATHTHAGPCVLAGRLGEASPVAVRAMVAAGAAAAREAVAQRVPCTVEWLEPVWTGIAHDRRRGEVCADAEVRALRWRDRDGALRGVLATYPCHPTSLGPLNRLLAPDYPGFVRQSVSEAWGVPCVFATGCAGDINTGHAASASFVTGGGDEGRTLADSERVGRRLADAVTGGRWEPLPGGRVEARTARVTLRQEPLEDERALVPRWRDRREGADAGVRALVDAWLAWADSPGAGRPATWTGSVGWLSVAGVDVYLLPGEPFVAADRWLVAGRRGLALGYYEDCPGYFPSREQYPLGGYEVLDAHRYYGMPAPFEAGSLERLVEVARSLRER